MITQETLHLAKINFKVTGSFDRSGIEDYLFPLIKRILLNRFNGIVCAIKFISARSFTISITFSHLDQDLVKDHHYFVKTLLVNYASLIIPDGTYQEI